MPKALSEYRAPSKLPSFFTLDTGKDASPGVARNTLPAFADCVICAGAPSVPREDRGIAGGITILPWCDSGGGARLLTGGEEFNLDVDVNREDVRPSPEMIELAARCCRRRKARGKATAAVVTASWREVESEQENDDLIRWRAQLGSELTMERGIHGEMCVVSSFEGIRSIPEYRPGYDRDLKFFFDLPNCQTTIGASSRPVFVHTI